MRKNVPMIGVLALLLIVTLCAADDGSARRYAEFAQSNDVDRMFSLLERKDVQDELNMTSEQVAKVARICHPADQDVPRLRELVAKSRKRQSDPALSPSEKDKLRESFNSDLGKCIKTYQRKELSAVLSAEQKKRLDELVIQMRGPIVMVDDADISSKLQLSEKQRAEKVDTTKHYQRRLAWLQGRYGRKQIGGLRAGETWEDRKKELGALFVVIRAIERERDAGLLMRLTPEQLSLWRQLQGKPLPIDWPPTRVADMAFDGG